MKIPKPSKYELADMEAEQLTRGDIRLLLLFWIIGWATVIIIVTRL
jgi:hypothetical protein